MVGAGASVVVLLLLPLPLLPPVLPLPPPPPPALHARRGLCCCGCGGLAAALAAGADLAAAVLLQQAIFGRLVGGWSGWAVQAGQGDPQLLRSRPEVNRSLSTAASWPLREVASLEAQQGRTSQLPPPAIAILQ